MSIQSKNKLGKGTSLAEVFAYLYITDFKTPSLDSKANLNWHNRQIVQVLCLFSYETVNGY